MVCQSFLEAENMLDSMMPTISAPVPTVQAKNILESYGEDDSTKKWLLQRSL